MNHRVQFGIIVFDELEFHIEPIGTLILRCHRLAIIKIIGFDPNWQRLGT
jgi:hypothetical protein